MKVRRTALLSLALPLLLFLACGDDGRAEREERQRAFVYAAYDGDLEKMKELYAQGVNIDAPTGVASHLTAPSLSLACERGHLEVVKFLLERGADVNVRDGDEKGTPLMSATWSRHEEIVKLLIARGADVNAVDSKGRSALSGPSPERRPCPEMIEILKQAGAKEKVTVPAMPNKSLTRAELDCFPFAGLECLVG
ncbi:MAG TPA: ankyrin repeat domain-containing protein [Pyrinomonadaceae bacterium]|nr:ankyrin repeat domain-containing protein [Pyrinomonadaceae bacterium]